MADKMTIKCNGIARNLTDWYELTPKEQGEFDYLDTEEAQLGASFVRYKGWVYDVNEFMCIDKRIAPHPQRDGWEKFDGYHSDSFFSGILLKYQDDYTRVIMATYFC